MSCPHEDAVFHDVNCGCLSIEDASDPVALRHYTRWLVARGVWGTEQEAAKWTAVLGRAVRGELTKRDFAGKSLTVQIYMVQRANFCSEQRDIVSNYTETLPP